METEERPELPSIDDDGAGASADLPVELDAVTPTPPVIPGYSLVRGVVAGNEYMVVSQSTAGGYYAFYPNVAAAASPAGVGVTASYYGKSLAAKLDITENGVTAYEVTCDANGETVGDPVDMDQLIMTAELNPDDTTSNHKHVTRLRTNVQDPNNGNKYFYLAMKGTGTGMLSSNTSQLTDLTFMTITGGTDYQMYIRYPDGSKFRYLQLNVGKDATINQAKWTNTSYWAPNATYLPLFLYQKNTTEEAEGFNIPGFTRLTEMPEEGFNPAKRYLIVSRTCTKELYALYHNNDVTTTTGGLSATDVHFAALVKTAETDGTPLESPTFTIHDTSPHLNAVQFKITSAGGGKYQISNGDYYLTLSGKMFTTTPANLTIDAANNGRFTIKNTVELDFNEAGGSNFSTYATDFWGPSTAKKDRALYIYESNEEDLTGYLSSLIDQAEALTEADYTAASWAALQAAVDAGKTVRDSSTATNAERRTAAENIQTALDALKLAAPVITGYEQVTSMDDLTDGYYLIVASYTSGGSRGFALLYPGATGNNAANAKAVTLGTGMALTAPDAATLEKAENVIRKSGDRYNITATGPNSETYQLRCDTQKVAYQTDGTSSIEITKSATEGGDYFRLKGPAGSYLIYVLSAKTFNQAGNTTGHEADWFPELYLYRRTGKDLPITLGSEVDNMLDGSGDNTWAFTGGQAVQGAYADIKGARSFVGHFEEYIRYTLVQKSGDVRQQRHTINTAYTGQALSDIIATDGWNRVKALDPKAVFYMPDLAEMTVAEGGDFTSFKADLTSFIQKGLAIRQTVSEPDAVSYVVLMKPYIHAKSPNAAAYGAAMQEVCEGLAAGQTKVLLVDAVTLADTQINTNGYPNAAGHLALGKALAEALTGGTIASFPSSNPAAFAAELTPTETTPPWKDTFAAPQTATGIQAAIQAKVNDTSTPLTWLFMGDSITHGAAWTYGYDGIAQSFEKFLKDDLGRTTDIVINTANSGSTTAHTVDNLEERVSKYGADVVSIMLGTNDAASRTVSVETYQQNLKDIVSAARTANPSAIIIFRTPTPTAASGRGEYIAEYVQAMKDVADELNGASPYILVIDQFTDWNALVMKAGDTTPSFLFSRLYDKDTNMRIHPGPIGHLWMTHELINALGLWDNNSAICKLNYDIGTIPTTQLSFDASAAVSVDKDARTVTMNYALLSAAMGENTYPLMGRISIHPTDSSSAVQAIEFTANRLQEAVPVVLPDGCDAWTISALELVDDNGTGKWLQMPDVEIDLATLPDVSVWTPLSGAGATGSVTANASGYVFTGSGNNYANATDIYYNSAVNTAVAAADEKFITFDVTPASTGSLSFGFALRVTDNTHAYYIGYDSSSHWYVQRYDGNNNLYNTFNRATAESGHTYKIRLLWDDTKVQLWIDGVEQTLPSSGGYDGVPNDALTAQFAIRGGIETSLSLTNLHYPGDAHAGDHANPYFYDCAKAAKDSVHDEDEALYTAKSWQAYKAALAVYDALKVTGEGHNTQEEVDAASLALINAINSLAEKPYEPQVTTPTGDIGFKWVDEAVTALKDGTYAVVTKGVCDNNMNRILYHTGSGKTDKLTVTATEVLTLNITASFTEAKQTWKLKKVEGGFTLQSVDSNRYLDLTTASGKNINTSADPVVLTITKSGDKLYKISQTGGQSLAFTGPNQGGNGMGNIYAGDTAAEVYLYLKQEILPEFVHDWHDLVPANGTTEGQPFLPGTGGSQNFRIPSVITLKNQKTDSRNGRIVAAIDARWNHAGDACSLDTILSYSDDNGETWHYSFPNYFGDTLDLKYLYGTAMIDPVMVEAEDGTIYMMVDVFPGGVAINTAPMQPAAATGFMTINNKPRLVLYESGVTSQQTDTNWLWYIGDFENGYATIYNKADDSVTSFYVDDHYYLYQHKGDSARTPADDRVYCQRIGGAEYIQQNVFFYNSALHVRNASYLWIVKSTDGGVTWSAPMMGNTARNDNQMFYGVGPGTGLSFVDAKGDNIIILPAYTFSNQIASFIYSTDNGETWLRSSDASSSWSSESCLVQISDTVARHFYRDGGTVLAYTDHTWDPDTQTWTTGTRQTLGTVARTANNQLSAITYSQLIDGKKAIIVSTAAGAGTSRSKGRLYTLLVDEDGSMTLGYTFAINETYYAYSSLTELADGSIGLIYEDDGAHVTWITYPIGEVANGASIGDNINITVPIYNSISITNENAEAIEEAVKASEAATALVAVTRAGTTLTFVGLKSGSVELTYGSEDALLTITITGEDDREAISLYVGDVELIEVSASAAVLYNSDETTVTAQVVEEAVTVSIVNGAKGNLGTTTAYDGATVSLKDALYTFTPAPEGNGFIVKNGTSYLHPSVNASGYPNASSEAVISISRGAADGSFYLSDGSRYLHFYRNTKYCFDKVTTTSGFTAECSFLLFRPALSGETSSVIPGYVQVTELADVTAGMYLIVAKVGSDYFALYPSASTSNKYSHVIKIDPTTTTNTTEIVNYPPEHYLKLTALAAGKADIIADGGLFAVTVRKAQVKAPTATPAPGAYTSAQNITLATETEGATIYYTLDGATPRKDDDTDSTFVHDPALSNDPCTFQFSSTTIKAFAAKEGMLDSEIVTFQYTFNLPIEISGFGILEDINVPYGISEADAKALLPTTVTATLTNGAESVLTVTAWTCLGKTERTEVEDDDGELVTVWTDPTGSFDSSVSGYYRFKATLTVPGTISKPDDLDACIMVWVAAEDAVAPVTATPAPGTYRAAQDVALACSTADTTIHYLLIAPGGGAPEETVYSAPIHLTSGAYTIIAWAELAGGATPIQSEESSFSYVIKLEKDVISVDSPAAVTVDYGTEKDDVIAQLPTTVSAVLDDGSKLDDIPVVWTCEDYDGTTAGQYTFSGTLTLPGDGSVTNTGDKTASATVTVSPNPHDLVNFDELNAAIEAAEAAAKGVTVSDQAASKVKKGTKFVSTEVMEALEAAIDEAKEALENAVSQAEADAAADDLALALSQFESAIQTGTLTTTPVTPRPTKPEEKEPVTETVTDPETGIVTETTTDPDGTITETVTEPDGTVTETVTEPDGTVTETVTEPDGTVAETVTEPDGTITETITDPEGKVTEAITTPEGDKTIVVTDSEGEKVAEITLPAAIPAPEEGFVDVPDGHWAEDAINTVHALGLVEGVGDNRFDMVSSMTRGSLTTILYRLSNEQPVTVQAAFQDVAADDWYADSVAWASKNGIVQGYSADTFAPNDVITREQLAIMLCRYAKLIGLDTAAERSVIDTFQDAASVHDWAADSVAWCVEAGILRGKGSNDLDPLAEISRAEVAVMLQRFLDLLR